jgi:L-threonylcarbamoyladenylate synthase
MSPNRPQILQSDSRGVAQAARLLRGGGLVAVPTETVYGLAADATNETAVKGIFDAKGRPGFNPLIVHVLDLEAARAIADMPPGAEALARAFWPGALTLVLPLAAGGAIAPSVTAGLPTIAIRVPAHPVMRAVLQAVGRPLAAPSANPSGRISATTASHVVADLGSAVDAVVDGGPCSVGVESTIVAPGPNGSRLLREGGIPRERIEDDHRSARRRPDPGPCRSAGATRAALRAPCSPASFGPAATARDRRGVRPGAVGPDAVGVRRPGEAASNLFAVLHDAEELALARNAPGIRVQRMPDEGLGRAINDRLRRAATPE